jgi:hypothetical protein
MSVDTAAEAPAICVEKQTVRAWTPVNRPDQTAASITAEKPTPKIVSQEPQPGGASASADQIKVNIEAEKPAIRVEPREAPIAFPVGLPESLVFHCVQPYELDSLTHLVKPISLAVASATTGCALGMIPLVHSALVAVSDLSKVTNDAMLWYLIYAMIFALSSGLAIIAWINTWRGRRDARHLLQQIRRRPEIPLSQVAGR